jgi:hypothetical protein
MMGVLLFCDADEQGKIIESLVGERIIPMKQYQHFFYLRENVEDVALNIPNYRIIDGQLTLEG